MKKTTFILMLLLPASIPLLYGQSEGKPLINMADMSSALRLEPYLGGSISFAHGDYVDYQKFFLNVEEEGSTFKGGIRPLIWGTAGIQLRYMPFADCVLEKLGMSLGMQYMQKGFESAYQLTYNGGGNYKDVTEYDEIFRNNYLVVPIQFRWGNKWFVTLGPTFNYHVKSTRTQKLYRDVSGSGAVNGGFKTTDKETKVLESYLVTKKKVDFSIGAGVQLSESFAIAGRANFGGKVLTDLNRNYNTIMIELSLYKAFEIIQF